MAALGLASGVGGMGQTIRDDVLGNNNGLTGFLSNINGLVNIMLSVQNAIPGKANVGSVLAPD